MSIWRSPDYDTYTPNPLSEYPELNLGLLATFKRIFIGIWNDSVPSRFSINTESN